MTRREAREAAFGIVFGMSFDKTATTEEFFADNEESGAVTLNDFSKAIVEKTQSNIDEIDAIISQYLKGWSLLRISRTSLAVLRISVAQMKYFDDIPNSVAINEAVEISKKFGSDDEYSFVNGLLGSIAATMPDDDKAVSESTDGEVKTEADNIEVSEKSE